MNAFLVIINQVTIKKLTNIVVKTLSVYTKDISQISGRQDVWKGEAIVGRYPGMPIHSVSSQ